MSGGFRHGHYLLGIEGLALLRAGAQRHLEHVERRAREIARIAGSLERPAYAARRDLPQAAPFEGYERWAGSYDDTPDNDTIAFEEPLVRGLLDDLPPGPVLDAACGTGRHAAYLSAAGRRVVGVDSSAAMLAVARAKLPAVDLRLGDLDALPVDDRSVAGVVCGLALSHLADMAPAIAEMGRVLAPGPRALTPRPSSRPSPACRRSSSGRPSVRRDRGRVGSKAVRRIASASPCAPPSPMPARPLSTRARSSGCPAE